MAPPNDLQANARQMRRFPTDAERHLWLLLRRRALGGHRFRRQVPIGPFIVDFLCPSAKLVVEVDGGHHGDDSDHLRDAWLSRQGYRVLRFWNSEVMMQTDVVLGVILGALRGRTPS